MNIIEVNGLRFNYNNIQIIDIPKLAIKKNEFVCISGKNSCGKTTLLKLLGGYIKTNNMVMIDSIYINDLNNDIINDKVGYLFYENSFFSKTVYDELSMYVNGLNKKLKIKKILSDFDMDKYLNVSPSLLSYKNSQTLALIKALLKKPDILFLDNPFSKLDSNFRRKIYTLLKKYASENNITVICTMNNLEDTLYCDRLIILENRKIILDGSPKLVYTEEKILSKIGLKLPKICELSEKLEMYELVSKIAYSEEELVEELC